MKIFPFEKSPIVSTLEIEEGRAKGSYKVNLVKNFDRTYLNPEMIRDLWLEAKQHDVLFSDYTQGDLRHFLDILSKPNSIWFIVFKDNNPVGIFYLTNIIPNMDGIAHFAFWDKIGGKREPLALDVLRLVMKQFNLERISAEIPAYQRGAIRFAKRLGFEKEGVRRHGVVYKGSWIDQVLFGILRSDVILVEVEESPELMEA